MTSGRVMGVVVVAALTGWVAACSSGSKATPGTVTVSRTTAQVGARVARSTLQFREVEPPSDVAVGLPPGARPCGTTRRNAAPGKLLLSGRTHHACYLVGPVLTTSRGVNGASVVYDSTQSQWAVDLHWGDRDFLDKVANPELVNEQVAIVLDGIVISAPTIETGITGYDVEITSQFSRADAVRLAASVAGVPAARVHVANREPRVP